MDVTPKPRALVHPDQGTPPDDDEMQVVYAMDVIDPIERRNGARYVRRFTYETREEAWAMYSEAIRCGLAAYVETVGRMPAPKRTPWRRHVVRSSSAAGSHAGGGGAVRGRSGQRVIAAEGGVVRTRGSASAGSSG